EDRNIRGWPMDVTPKINVRPLQELHAFAAAPPNNQAHLPGPLETQRTPRNQRRGPGQVQRLVRRRPATPDSATPTFIPDPHPRWALAPLRSSATSNRYGPLSRRT